MVFNSLTFAVFFACVLAIHNLPLGWAQSLYVVAKLSLRRLSAELARS